MGGTPAASAPRATPAPAEPLSSAPLPDDLAALDPDRDESPLPDEARRIEVRSSAAATVPSEAGRSGVLNVRFTRGADPDRIVLAMEELRALLKARPGETRVVFHLPQSGGATLPMEIRGGVAYDLELVAEARRKLGDGLVNLELVPR